jgi:hypothetical protein
MERRINKEREQHPCLTEHPPILELLKGKQEKKYKAKDNTANLCQYCGIKPVKKKLKSNDGLKLRLCEECYMKLKD